MTGTRHKLRTVALAAGLATAGLVLVPAERPVEAQTPTPDLVVSIFSVTVSGSDATFDVTLCSRTALLSPVRLRLWTNLATPPECGTTGYDTDISYTFSTAGCVSLPFKLTGLSPGTYHTRILLDATCTLREFKDNNIGHAAFTIGTGTTPTYTGGQRHYVGLSARTHAPGRGLAAMQADCHATYRGSRVCTPRNILNTVPAPVPPREAWLLQTANSDGWHSINTNCNGEGGRPFLAWSGQEGTTLDAAGDLVKAPCETFTVSAGRTVSGPRALPAACCKP